MPPSSFFLSTAEVEPLRKLRSRFSRIYVQTLVTEIDRCTTRKWKLAYDIDTTISRSNISEAIFLRYNSSRVDLYRRTKDLRISSSFGDTGVPYDTQSTVSWFRVNCSYNASLSTSQGSRKFALKNWAQNTTPWWVLWLQNSSSTTAAVWHSNKPRFRSCSWVCPLGIKKISISRNGAFSSYFL